MDEERPARKIPRAEQREQSPTRSPVVPAESSAYPAARDARWAGAPTSQVVRTVATACSPQW